MTTHELANILLQQEDVPVHFQYFHDELECNLTSPVGNVCFYNGVVYLAESHFVSPEEEEAAREEEWRRAKEECRRKEEADAKLPTLKNVFKLVSEETRNAFVLYIDDRHICDNILNNSHEEPEWLVRILLTYYKRNARLSKEYMLEIFHACIQFGIAIPESIITTIENHDISQNQRDMFKSETDRRWLESLRNKKK